MLEFYRPKCDVLECLLPLAEDLCEREENHKSARVFIDGVAYRVEVTESMWNKSLAMIHVFDEISQTQGFYSSDGRTWNGDTVGYLADTEDALTDFFDQNPDCDPQDVKVLITDIFADE